MTETSYYEIENFEMSYEYNQKEMRRIIIYLRAKNEWSFELLSTKSGINKEILAQIELGYKNITLLNFIKILIAYEIL